MSKFSYEEERREHEERIAKFKRDVAKRSRFMRFLLALDQLFNVLIWNGSQDETISSHVGRRITSGEAYRAEKWLCAFLRRFEGNHCKKSRGE